MANIDAACGFSFIKSPKFDPKSELLYFADVCAGPGGFSEYVMWRMGWRAKGVGFTLRAGGLDFKLAKFNPRSPWDTFFPFYGPDDDGDIYRTDNMQELRRVVSDITGGKMLHFVMADGGCDFEGNENAQELLNKQLLLCQVCSGHAHSRSPTPATFNPLTFPSPQRSFTQQIPRLCRPESEETLC